MRAILYFTVLLSSGVSALADDASQILKNTEDTYNNLNSYRFEGTTVSETRMGATDSKSETTFVVAFKPANEFRIEYVYPAAGNWVRVSDGKTLWKYRSLTKELNKGPVSDYDLQMLSGSPVGVFSHISQGLANPSVVGSEPVSAGGQSFDCYVIQAEHPGAMETGNAKALPVKLWIDKKTHLVLREQSGSVSHGSATTENLETITFTRVEVNQPVADDVFKFNRSKK
jgi:outer membrane lipoprotein-sorting protein